MSPDLSTLDGEVTLSAAAQTHDALQPGLALLRGLRRQYVMGRLTHAQLLMVCGLAHELATTTPCPEAVGHGSEQSIASHRGCVADACFSG